MAQPFVGEIRMFAGNFAPQGWALCQGQQLAISENETLFNLIGTTYGGDGQQTFNLPDLQGRAPIHMGAGFVIGQNGGVENVTLTGNQLPSHNHLAAASGGGDVVSPDGAVWSTDPGGNTAAYTAPMNNAPTMSGNAIGSNNVNGVQPHDNMQPFLVVNYIISLFGIFPSQN
jgi:microcystin-dependent protein